MTGLALGVLVAQPVFACDLKAFPFGKDGATVAKAYGLDDVRAGDLVKTDVRASTVCDTLPPTAILHFTFLKGTLAEVAVQSLHAKGELLALVEAQFGKAKQRPPEGHPMHDRFHSSWAEGNKPVVLYSMTPAEKGTNEYLKISSRDYSDAIGDVMVEKNESLVKGKE